MKHSTEKRQNWPQSLAATTSWDDEVVHSPVSRTRPVESYGTCDISDILFLRLAFPTFASAREEAKVITTQPANHPSPVAG
ncbi:hypothetical protein [Paraburkholderia sp. RL17-381-BIF-C]|uniref:hypothetical protein n=1 Tax=Paraburkholderia sp. RL17-381-BIF-C TaxID=3031635 RepID=UPI0038BCAEFE